MGVAARRLTALLERARRGAAWSFAVLRSCFGTDRALQRLPPALAATLFVLAFFALPGLRFPGGSSLAVYDRNGELLGATVSPTGQWRFPPGGGLPQKFVEALVTYEDRRFFSHPGVDPASLVRAAVQNTRAHEIVSGGSTLSMQAARLARPGRPRNLGEKLVEAWLALRIELTHSKMGVLALYAENAPFGGNVVGIEAASFRFFERPPQSLSWAEAATLAVLPNAPSVANPGKNRALLLDKRDRLLEALRERGRISAADLALAEAEPLPPDAYPLPRLAPRVVDLFAKERGPGTAGEAQSRVVTTIDASIQRRSTDIAARRLGALAGEGVHNAACLVADLSTGAVLAYVSQSSGSGGAAGDDERSGSQVDLIRAERSSGSLLKPFLYAAAIDSGELGPRSLLPDLPTRYGSYGPENYNGMYTGAVRADEALARSLNVPFVRLLRSYGVERFYSLLRSTGMTTLRRPSSDYGLTLILGGAETTLWEISGRFAALARTAAGAGPVEGRPAPGRSGQAAGQYFDLGLSRGELAGRRIRPNPFSRAAALLTLDALTNVARPEEESAWQDYASSRRIAWKTGTSFGNRDAWAVGVDGRFVVGVWTGNATGEGMPALMGSAAAAP
ncbi:MAG TPA: penicillin-binding protein 1C, partial [Rectinemataceae bacterium]|nr:penicillin-binding protein 1C [Rectinemataceae bacterium]